MATITKRGSRWSVQVRRKGAPPQSRSFPSHAEAKAWASAQDAKIDRGEMPLPRQQLSAITIGDVITRYIQEVTPTKRSAETERFRLRKLQADPLGALSLLDLRSSHLADYRDRRLQSVKPATVRRELAALQHAFEIARRDWGLPLAANPLSQVRLPKSNDARTRRISADEQERLFKAVAEARNPLLLAVVGLAIETGLRRGELLNLRWEHVDLTARVAHIPLTKTGQPRSIPLTDRAVRILVEAIPAAEGAVFAITGNAVRLAWTRAMRRAGVANMRFHDLRHEAVSRFFELGLSLPEVAIISGHRDPRMLFRYTHLRPAELAEKLRGKEWKVTPFAQP